MSPTRERPVKDFTIQILNYIHANKFWIRQIHSIWDVSNRFLIFGKSPIFKMKHKLKEEHIVVHQRNKRYGKPTKYPKELIWKLLKWKLIQLKSLFSLIHHACVTRIEKTRCSCCFEKGELKIQVWNLIDWIKSVLIFSWKSFSFIK